MANDTDWLSRKQAAEYLTRNGFPISWRTLARMASKKPAEGPPYQRFMWRTTAYARAELLAWAKAQTVVVRGSVPLAGRAA